MNEEIDITNFPKFQKREKVRVIDPESDFYNHVGYTTMEHHYPWVVFNGHLIEHFQETQLEKA